MDAILQLLRVLRSTLRSGDRLVAVNTQAQLIEEEKEKP